MMRPKCDIPNCDKKAQNQNTKKNPRWRKAVWVREEFGVENGYICSNCHYKKIADNNGEKNIQTVIAKNAGFDTHQEHLEFVAKKAGFESHNKFICSKHPYKKYRKDFCENIDGRLGFKCTTTIIDPEWQLDTDHINGDPSDNREENLQTFCKCCHSIKTRDSRDYASPGRKALNLRAA